MLTLTKNYSFYRSVPSPYLIMVTVHVPKLNMCLSEKTQSDVLSIDWVTHHTESTCSFLLTRTKRKFSITLFCPFKWSTKLNFRPSYVKMIEQQAQVRPIRSMARRLWDQVKFNSRDRSMPPILTTPVLMIFAKFY